MKMLLLVMNSGRSRKITVPESKKYNIDRILYAIFWSSNIQYLKFISLKLRGYFRYDQD